MLNAVCTFDTSNIKESFNLHCGFYYKVFELHEIRLKALNYNKLRNNTLNYRYFELDNS